MNKKCNRCRFRDDRTVRCVSTASEYSEKLIDDIPDEGCDQFYSEDFEENIKMDEHTPSFSGMFDDEAPQC